MSIVIQNTKQIIEDFNSKHKVGESTITYKDESGNHITALLRWPAEILEGVGPVVWVAGRVGCVKLEDVIL